MQNACDEREIRNRCLVCLRCVVQSGLQKCQHDAFCRRLWSSVNYAALPYLLELHVRWDAYRSQCTPPPRHVGCRVTMSSTLQFQLPAVTFQAQRLSVCLSLLSQQYKQFVKVKCKLRSVDSLFNDAVTFWAVLSRTLAQLVNSCLERICEEAILILSNVLFGIGLRIWRKSGKFLVRSGS